MSSCLCQSPTLYHWSQGRYPLKKITRFIPIFTKDSLYSDKIVSQDTILGEGCQCFFLFPFCSTLERKKLNTPFANCLAVIFDVPRFAPMKMEATLSFAPCCSKILTLLASPIIAREYQVKVVRIITSNMQSGQSTIRISIIHILFYE